MRPAHKSAQAGLQAGPVAEGTGPRAGPDRVLGRGSSRDFRPCGRPSPVVRPGCGPREPASRPVQADAQAGVRAVTPAAGGDQNGGGRGKSGAGKEAKSTLAHP